MRLVLGQRTTGYRAESGKEDAPFPAIYAEPLPRPLQLLPTLLAQERGFFWMAQGLSATPLWLMARRMRPLL